MMKRPSIVTFSSEPSTVHSYEGIQDSEKLDAFYSQRELNEFAETDQTRREASERFNNEQDLEEYLELQILERILMEDRKDRFPEKMCPERKFVSNALKQGEQRYYKAHSDSRDASPTANKYVSKAFTGRKASSTGTKRSKIGNKTNDLDCTVRSIRV